MAPVVRITDQTWDRLKRHGEALVDTADSVINTALDALDAARGEVGPKPKNLLPRLLEQSRQNKGEITPQRDFRKPLLHTLLKMGGKAPTADIRATLQKLLSAKLKPGDYEHVSSGEIRWWNAVCWERMDLVRENLLRKDSPRGIWELTEVGKAEANKPTYL